MMKRLLIFLIILIDPDVTADANIKNEIIQKALLKGQRFLSRSCDT